MRMSRIYIAQRVRIYKKMDWKKYAVMIKLSKFVINLIICLGFTLETFLWYNKNAILEKGED